MLTTERLPALVLAFAWLSLAAPAAPAQSPSSPALAAAVLQLGQVNPTPKKPKLATKPAAPTAKGAAATETPGAAAKTSTPPAGDSKDAAQDDESFVTGMVRMIKSNAVIILVVLGAALLAVMAWALLSGRGKEGSVEAAFDELGLAEKAAPKPSTRFSSTKIQASDVNARLARNVKSTEVETDREYALVVDEEALKMPPVPDDPVATGTMDAVPVRRLLEAKDLRGAFDEYQRQTQGHSMVPFEADVELQLGESLLRSRDLNRAAQVLERHVTTRTRAEVPAETFFNLGYIHFVNKTFAKSRKYLDIFVEVEKNPAYVERARKILERLRGSPAKN